MRPFESPDLMDLCLDLRTMSEQVTKPAEHAEHARAGINERAEPAIPPSIPAVALPPEPPPPNCDCAIRATAGASSRRCAPSTTLARATSAPAADAAGEAGVAAAVGVASTAAAPMNGVADAGSAAVRSESETERAMRRTSLRGECRPKVASVRLGCV